MARRSDTRSPLHSLTLVLLTVAWLVVPSSVDAATIVAEYQLGYRDVIINGYGTDGMGRFELADGDRRMVALCIEADVAHSMHTEAYAPVTSTVRAPELDTLLWWLERQPSVDGDTAVAAAALAWFWAGARRDNGALVWADGTRSFAPITPLAPVPWDALPMFSVSSPIGLTAPGVHLDQAERRVAELARMIAALTGPWRIDARLDGQGAVGLTLSAANGPVAGQTVGVRIVTPNGPAQTTAARTGANGQATVTLPSVPDGAVIYLTADAPGPHREWDGAGVQRLATPSTVTITSTVAVPPLPRHVVVRKRSADPTIGVAGAQFTLTDAAGDTFAIATSDTDGTARFAPIDPTAHPAPYTVSETKAPPGLLITSDQVRLDEASTDATTPTLVTIVDEPRRAEVSVRKRLSHPVGPGDLSGFTFGARRRSDGTTHTLVSGADGVTAPVGLPLGTYDICEQSVPDWATLLVDGGCVELTIDLPAFDRDAAVVDYLNIVPSPAIDTRASDPLDGDQELPHTGGRVVDRVELSGLIPGTRYTVAGQLLRVDASGDATVAAVGSTWFVADRAELIADVEFGVDLEVELGAGVPATFTAPQSGPSDVTNHAHVELVDGGDAMDTSDDSGTRLVIVERVLLGDMVLVEHYDLSDTDQTIRIAPPPTTTTTTSPPVSTTTTTVTTTTTATTLPNPSVPPTLPRTGSDDTLRHVLRLGDAGFVLGVAMIALAGLAPRRPGRTPSTR